MRLVFFKTDIKSLKGVGGVILSMATMMVHGHAVSIVAFLTILQFQNIAFKADI
jgi:hypothetical protein